MAWQNVYGSWKRDPNVKGDIIMGGGSNFRSFPGNPPGSPSPYGKGINISTVGTDKYRFNLSLVGYGVDVATGSYFPTYYQGSTSDIYQWIIKAAISYDDVANPANAKYTNLFQENLKRTFRGQDPLYAYANWQSCVYENTSTNTFTATSKDAWIRIEIYGEPAVEPLFAYFKLGAAIDDFRPYAIRKGGIFKSLDTNTGFFRIRKNGSWSDVPKMTFDEVGKENQGTSRIRKNGKFVGQNKIGN